MKTLINNIWYYISYPLRLYFQERVSLYKELLLIIESVDNLLIIKARRMGMTENNIRRVFQRQLLISKLTRFINRWDFKENNYGKNS